MAAKIYINHTIAQLILVQILFYLACFIAKSKAFNFILVVFRTKVNRLAAILKNDRISHIIAQIPTISQLPLVVVRCRSLLLKPPEPTALVYTTYFHGSNTGRGCGILIFSDMTSSIWPPSHIDNYQVPLHKTCHISASSCLFSIPLAFFVNLSSRPLIELLLP